MSDEKAPDAGDEIQFALEQTLAASSLGPLTQRQDGVAEMLVQDGPGWQIQKLTHLRSFEESKLYAKAHYRDKLIEAVSNQDMDAGFQFPPMDELLRADYALRDSSKQQTRKILESITKIFDRGGEGGGGRGFFGRRRG